MSIAAYPAHSEYKASGYDWVGDVPAHWNVEKLGTCLTTVSCKGRPDLPLLSITREKGVIERDVDDQESNHNFIPEDLSNYKVLTAGQFGVNKMKAWQGSYGISGHTGIVSPAYFVFDIAREIDPGFFNLALRSKLYVSYFAAASDGVRIGQWDLSKTRMREIPMLLPPLPEQRAIAVFLKEKCGKIDEAVRIKEEQIALLRERRQILIQQAVTRGTNLNAPLKDSGIDWIGQIPAHWKVKRFTKEVYVQEGPGIMAVDFRDEGVPLIRISGVRTNAVTLEGCNYLDHGKVRRKWSHFLLEEGDLVISGSASTGLVAEAGQEAAGAILYTGLMKLRIRNNGSLLKKYFKHFLASALFDTQVELLKAGSTIAHYGPSHLGKMFIVVPPFEEQQEVAAYCARENQRYESAIAIKEEQITALREYKTSLINAAVTGKIKVA